MLMTVLPRTTKVTEALSPIIPVVPGVPRNSAFKSWKPTSTSEGTVRLTSIIPMLSVVPTAVTAVPSNDTVT